MTGRVQEIGEICAACEGRGWNHILGGGVGQCPNPRCSAGRIARPATVLELAPTFAPREPPINYLTLLRKYIRVVYEQTDQHFLWAMRDDVFSGEEIRTIGEMADEVRAEIRRDG